jgi:DNA polymerase-1
MFELNGLLPPKLKYDTIVMAHINDSNDQIKLEKLVKSKLKKTKKTFEEIIGKKWHKIVWNDSVLDLLAEYACEDVFYEYKLHEYFLKELKQDPEDLLSVYEHIELPLVPVIKDMHKRGVRIDLNILKDIGVNITSRIDELLEDIYDEAGAVFNMNSPDQKAKILFDKLKLTPIKETTTGKYSTDSDTLEALAAQGHTIAEYMVEYSGLQKLNSGYVESIPRFVDRNNILRCNFNSTGTTTGRFSSDKPNLQNQPNNDEFPIRKAFIPRQGYTFIDLDYSQIELRVMGHVSNDPKFCEAFLNGEDIHQRVANELGITRKQAKTINFGIIYGMGPAKLANMLGITVKEAKAVIYGYESTFKGYYIWKTKTENFATRNKYVRTIFGRVRRLPLAGNSSFGLHSSAMRQAINTCVQGSAADIIKRSMVALSKEYISRNLDAHMLLQVHDELLIEVRKDQACEVFDLTKHIMENTTKLRVPLEVDGKIISDWSQMKDDNIHSLYNFYKKQNTNFPVWLMQ